MRTNDTPELRSVARRVVWFHEPEFTLKDPQLFLAHVMRYATVEDLLVVSRYFDDADFNAVLDDAPAGIFDKRSWHFWHLRMGRDTPPLPTRTLDLH